MSNLDTTPNETTISGEGTASVSKRTRNYTLAMLVAIYASSHVDRQIVSILAESIKQDLLLSDSQLGFLIGLSFALFYATLGIPIAMLADRYSRRNIIAASVIVWSGMTALCGLAVNYTQLALARIGVGIGEAGSSPPSHSMISDLFLLKVAARRWAFTQPVSISACLSAFLSAAGLMNGMAGALPFLLSVYRAYFLGF